MQTGCVCCFLSMYRDLSHSYFLGHTEFLCKLDALLFILTVPGKWRQLGYLESFANTNMLE